MLKSFANLNARWSLALLRRYPLIFGDRLDHIAHVKNNVQNSITKLRNPVVLEVGGIDRNLIDKHPSYHYIGLDIDEKPRCQEVYDDFLVQSIEEPLPLSCDIIFSANLLEHVRDNRAAFRHMFEALVSGGETFHYIPSKNHIYSWILRLVGQRCQRWLIGTFFPPGSLERAGYRTYFDHCSPRQMRTLMGDVGFAHIEMLYMYRANGYFRFFLPAYIGISLFECVVRAFRLNYFCAGMIVCARKP